MAAVKFEVYRGADSQFHFKFFGRDGKELAVSKGFQHKDGCMEAIREVKENCGPSGTFEKKAVGEKVGFLLRMPNRKVVLEGGPYDNDGSRDAAMADVKLSSQAVVIERA